MATVKDKIKAALDNEGEAWKPDHDAAMACYQWGDFIALGMRHYCAIRAEDEAWSRQVQLDHSKFDASVAKYLRSKYEWWIEPCEEVLKGIRAFENVGYIVDGADDFRKAWALVRAILSTPIDEVISAMEHVQKGQYEDL